MLTVTNSGIVEVLSLQESIPLSWSPHGQLTFAYGKSLVGGSVVYGSPQDDIASSMKNLVQSGYGMDVRFCSASTANVPRLKQTILIFYQN